MSDSSLSLRDAESGELVPLSRHARVVWSSGAERWGVLAAERLAFPAGELRPFRVEQPAVWIHLAPSARVESEADGARERRVLARGDASLLAMGVTRRVRLPETELLWIALSPALVARAGAETGHGAAIELLERPQLRDSRLLHIGLALQAEVAAGHPSGRVYGEALGLALAAHLASRHAVRSTPRVCRGGIAPLRLQRVLDYIEANLAEELRVRTLAAVAGLSEHRFAHNFKQATGLAPHRYVNGRRVARARQLLRETDMTVTSVAHALGFGSASRFAIVFRRTAGTTPSSFRASCR